MRKDSTDDLDPGADNVVYLEDAPQIRTKKRLSQTLALASRAHVAEDFGTYCFVTNPLSEFMATTSDAQERPLRC